MEITNIIFAGVGGQGILMASDILADVALRAGLDVKKSEVHGMAQRGGSVVSHVRFGPKVHSPLIPKGQAHFIVSFEKLEALRYLDYLRPEGTVILNDYCIIPQTVQLGEAEYPKDIEDLCRQHAAQVIVAEATDRAVKLGNVRVLNVLMLGLLSQFLPLPQSLWEEVIAQRVPPKYLELNRQAFQEGKRLGLQARESASIPG